MPIEVAEYLTATNNYSYSIRKNKIKTLLPDLDKLKTYVQKDIKAINKRIEKVGKITNLKYSNDREESLLEYLHYINKAYDFLVIREYLNKIIEDYYKIIRNIKDVWEGEVCFSEDSDEGGLEDLYRSLSPIYLVNMNEWINDFHRAAIVSNNFLEANLDNIDKEFEGFIKAHMKHSLKYLSKFGVVWIMQQDHPRDASSLNCSTFEATVDTTHPWFKKICLFIEEGDVEIAKDTIREVWPWWDDTEEDR